MLFCFLFGAQEGDPAECGGLQVALVKLTRTSWQLTFDAVAAAFNAAADALAYQLSVLARLGCVPMRRFWAVSHSLKLLSFSDSSSLVKGWNQTGFVGLSCSSTTA